jgi:hypothetical protein
MSEDPPSYVFNVSSMQGKEQGGEAEILRFTIRKNYE